MDRRSALEHQNMATAGPSAAVPCLDKVKCRVKPFSIHRSVNKQSRSLSPPPSLLGPLEEIFHLLADFFHSRKSLSISKSVARGLMTIYQNLKIIRVHAIVQVQFANDLKIRLVDLKRQLEDARKNHHPLETIPTKNCQGPTALPDPSLRKIIPVLDETEKILSTLHLFMSKQPRLRLSIPSALINQLGLMSQNLVRFPDHLAKQLNECKTLLQRIVVYCNQLAEAHRALKRLRVTPSAPLKDQPVTTTAMATKVETTTVLPQKINSVTTTATTTTTTTTTVLPEKVQSTAATEDSQLSVPQKAAKTSEEAGTSSSLSPSS